MRADLHQRRLLLRETLAEPPEQGSLALSASANLATLRELWQANSRAKANLVRQRAD